MTSIAFLVLLGLMGTVCSNPVPAVCPSECTVVDNYHHPHFEHIPDLANSSVAPWSLMVDSDPDRLPQSIRYAVCTTCTVEHMIAKPIKLEISVYHKIPNNSSFRCKCPYKLAVGCTCVRGKQQ